MQRTAPLILLILFLLFSSCGVQSPGPENTQEQPIAEVAERAADSETADDSTEDGDLDILNDYEVVDGYTTITWWDLISEPEYKFFVEENKKFKANPAYKPTQDPPEPGTSDAFVGKKVRIPGFIVGMDTVPDNFSKVENFLFVPFQGACIHVPPPPPNQTIFTIPDKPVDSDPFNAFWMYGVLTLERGSNELAEYYYTFEMDYMEMFQNPMF
jgi:hypothetical protein